MEPMDLERARNHLSCGLARYASYRDGFWCYELRNDGNFTAYCSGRAQLGTSFLHKAICYPWYLTNELPK